MEVGRRELGLAPPRTGVARRSGAIAREALRLARQKPLGAAGAAIIVIMVAVTVMAPVIAESPYAIDASARLQAPGARHWLGTDDLGRDLWSRIVYGAQISLYVGLLSVGIGSTIGGALGLVSAYYGRQVDAVIQRFMDALMAFPTLILALAIMASLGQSINNVVLAIAVVQLPRAARVVRSQAISVKEADYVSAARAIGCSDTRIMFRHVLPQCVAPWIVIATAALGTAIIIEASLSFLGLGVPPPEPSWGSMLSGRARDFYVISPWLAVWPGLAIALVVYGFNLFGDALRDILDPRLRGT